PMPDDAPVTTATGLPMMAPKFFDGFVGFRVSGTANHTVRRDVPYIVPTSEPGGRGGNLERRVVIPLVAPVRFRRVDFAQPVAQVGVAGAAAGKRGATLAGHGVPVRDCLRAGEGGLRDFGLHRFPTPFIVFPQGRGHPGGALVEGPAAESGEGAFGDGDDALRTVGAGPHLRAVGVGL